MYVRCDGTDRQSRREREGEMGKEREVSSHILLWTRSDLFSFRCAMALFAGMTALRGSSSMALE